MKESYCILTGIYAPDTGGPAKFAQTFSEFVHRAGFNAHVITYTNSKNHTQVVHSQTIEATSRGLPIALRYLRSIVLINKQINLGSKIIANGCFIELAILRIFRKFDFVVKVPGDIVWERARNTSQTSLGIVEFQESRLSWKYRLFRLLYSFSVRSATSVIVPSSQLYSLACKWGAKTSSIHLIYNSISVPEVFEPCATEYDFVTVSRLVPWKGVDKIIEEICGQGLSLLIVGDGPERSSLFKLSLRYPKLVTFAGEIEASSVGNYLKKAQYFVLNSSFEATSYALIEAMALGLVPIANGGTGSAEVIRHGINGLLYGNDSNLSFREAIHTVKADKELSRKMALEAHHTVDEKFNIKHNYHQIMELAKNV